MFMAAPQWKLSFQIESIACTWIVNGEQELEAVCRALRWNGVSVYTVTPVQDDDPES